MGPNEGCFDYGQLRVEDGRPAQTEASDTRVAGVVAALEPDVSFPDPVDYDVRFLVREVAVQAVRLENYQGSRFTAIEGSQLRDKMQIQDRRMERMWDVIGELRRTIHAVDGKHPTVSAPQ